MLFAAHKRIDRKLFARDRRLWYAIWILEVCSCVRFVRVERVSKPNFGLSAAVGFPGDTLSTSSLLLVGLVFIREHYV